MRLFGLPGLFGRRTEEKALSAVPEGRGGWLPLVREAFAGAWQRNITVDQSLVTAYHAVFACATLIASDVAKLRIKLVEQRASGIWLETASRAYSPVLRRPNPVQNRIQFWESWLLSKLLRGNAYVLKRRDNRNVVVALYVLDPGRVRPLVADDGSVFYEIHADNLSGVTGSIVVPAREVIHDRWNCLFHPLVGVSPIYANGLAATQGLRIQEASTRLFLNDSTPGGLLVAPGRISEETAARLKEHWEKNYGGRNVGRVAVLGDGLKYEQMAVNPVDAQLVEQLRWTAEVVCSTFHVPPYKIGIGQMPTYSNIQALNVEYYSQCLQRLLEDAELSLDEGLEMPATFGTEFDIDGLLRMDSVTQMAVLKEGVGAGVMAPNDARRKIDLPSVEGGDSPYLQQQNYSLAALAKRDARPDPFAKDGGSTAAASPPPAPAASRDDGVERQAALLEIYRGLR